MKNKFTIGHFVLIIGSSMFFIAAGTQQDKENKKEPHQKELKQGPGQDRDNKADKGKNKDRSEKERNDNSNGKGSNEYKGQKEKGNKENERDETNNGSDKDDKISKKEMKDGYKWDKESFKERKKYRNSDKVTICHKFSRDSETPVTISVSSNALKAHLGHGDVQGDCPVVNNDKLSDNFLRKRTEYYNTIENNQEQVSYSKSILEYAQERLETSRRQLALMQNNKVPPADIQRKQAVVSELEKDVSLLGKLIGVAADLVSNKLQ